MPSSSLLPDDEDKEVVEPALTDRPKILVDSRALSIQILEDSQTEPPRGCSLLKHILRELLAQFLLIKVRTCNSLHLDSDN